MSRGREPSAEEGWESEGSPVWREACRAGTDGDGLLSVAAGARTRSNGLTGTLRLEMREMLPEGVQALQTWGNLQA